MQRAVGPIAWLAMRRWHRPKSRSTRDASFDHLVGAGEKRWRDGDGKRLGGLEVDDQLERSRLHNWQLSGFGTLENLSNINALLAKDIAEARSITDQAAGHDVFAEPINCWDG